MYNRVLLSLCALSSLPAATPTNEDASPPPTQRWLTLGLSVSYSATIAPSTFPYSKCYTNFPSRCCTRGGRAPWIWQALDPVVGRHAVHPTPCATCPRASHLAAAQVRVVS